VFYLRAIFLERRNLAVASPAHCVIGRKKPCSDADMSSAIGSKHLAPGMVSHISARRRMLLRNGAPGDCWRASRGPSLCCSVARPA
jgi:hypothetical protein